MIALCLALALGCTSDTDTESPVDTGDPAEASDEDLARWLISGTGELQDTLMAVAWSGGWPVRTRDDTWIFVAEGEGVSLAGDHNGWEPVAMEQAEGFCWAKVELSAPEGSGYKLVRGEDYQADPWSRSYGYDDFGRISWVRPEPASPHLERLPALEGQGLLAREVRVYVPAGDGPWPVLYMHDGNNLFDPQGMWGGWRMQEALVGVEPVLVVGLDNTAARMDEYVHTTDHVEGRDYGGLGDAYVALLHEDLRPRIESLYPTTGPTGVMGSSLGGLISLYTAHLHPEDYDFAGSLSGTLGWGRYGTSNPVMEELFLAEGHRPFTLYVDSGGDDGGDGCADPDGDGFPEDDPNTSDNYCDNRHFADALAEAGYTWEQDLFHWWDEGAPHNEAAWAARVHLPLEVFTSLD